METEKKKRCCCRRKAADNYPGTAVDKADGEKVTKKEVKDETAALNNNPRTHDA